MNCEYYMEGFCSNPKMESPTCEYKHIIKKYNTYESILEKCDKFKTKKETEMLDFFNSTLLTELAKNCLDETGEPTLNASKGMILAVKNVPYVLKISLEKMKLKEEVKE